MRASLRILGAGLRVCNVGGGVQNFGIPSKRLKGVKGALGAVKKTVPKLGFLNTMFSVNFFL